MPKSYEEMKKIVPKDYVPRTKDEIKMSAYVPEAIKQHKEKLYGKETPEVSEIEKQAELHNLQSGEKETTIFLGNAVADGVLKPEEASRIFKNITGRSDFLTEKNISEATDYVSGVVTTRLNGNVPLWRNNVSKNQYGNLTESEVASKISELSAKDSLTPQERNDYYYLIGLQTPDEINQSISNMKEKASEEWDLYKKKSKDKSEAAQKEAEKHLYNYKYYTAGINALTKKVNPAKLRAIKKEFVDPAMADPTLQEIIADKSKKFQKGDDIYLNKAKWIADVINGHSDDKTRIGLVQMNSSYLDYNNPESLGALGELKGEISLATGDFARIHEMTEEEKNTFLYWLEKSGEEKALEYFDAIAPEIDKRIYVKETERVRNEANKNPIWANTKSVISQAYNTPEAFGTFIAEAVDDDEFNAFAPGFKELYKSEEVRSTTSENIDNGLLRFIYNSGMSMADSVAVMPMGGKVSPLLLSMNAASSKARQTALEGGTKNEILTKGLAAGALEFALEKIGIDNLFGRKATGKFVDWLMDALKQSGVEATEEFCTTVANNFIDDVIDVIGGNDSEREKLVQKYVAEGYSLEEAKRLALIDMAGSVAIDTLAGAFSGGIFGSVGGGYSYVSAKNLGGKISSAGNAEKLVDYGLMQNEDSSAFKRATKLSGKNANKAKIGALLQQLVIDEQITEKQADALVSGEFDGVPLDEAAQTFFFAGARGVPFIEVARMSEDLDIGGDAAYNAWVNGQKFGKKQSETVNTPKELSSSESISEPVNSKAKEYFEEQKKTIKPTISSDNFSNEVYNQLSQSTRKAVDALGNNLGVVFKFSNGEAVASDGEVIIDVSEIVKDEDGSVDGDELVRKAAVKSAVRAIKQIDPELYNDFIEFASQHSDNSMESYYWKFKKQGLNKTIDDAYDAMVEDYFAFLMGMESEIRTLANKNRNLYDVILEIIDRIIDLLTGSYNNLRDDLTAARKLFRKALTEIGETTAVNKTENKTTAVNKNRNAVRDSSSAVQNEKAKTVNNDRAGSFVRENYNDAAEKFRTEENAEMFDVAYSQGLLGERLNLGVIVPDKDVSAVSQAYVAGTRDARIISERRANFDNRTPGLFTDAVTEQLSKKIGSRTLKAIDALGKKLGVQIRFIQRGEAGHEKYSYYSPSEGVIAINVNELHGKLTGDKLIRFIANHEGVHRIRETSPKAYAEMKKIALSKSKQTVEDRMARFGESKERATEEIVADYFGEVLTSKAEIKTLMNEHRTVFDAIMEALEWLVDKMKGIANYSFSEIAEARKLFQEALEEADANVWGAEARDSGETVYSAEFSFSKQVEDALSGKMKRGYSVYVGKTPNLLTKAGLPADLPMLINQGHLRNINAPKDPNNRHLHGIDKDTIKQLPSLLKNPVMIYDSISEDNKENTVCVLTNKKNEDGEPIIVAISYSEQGNKYLNVEFVKQKTEKSNFVKSMYGREGFIPHLTEIIDTDAVLYVNKAGIEKVLDIKNETLKLNSDSKLELLARLDSLGFDTIIHQSNNVVKGESSDKLQSRSEPDIFFSRSEDSEDNVKYFPPGEDPRRDIKVPSEVNGKKVRRTYRTAAESPALTPEMAETLVDRITTTDIATYEVSSNKALADYAMNKVENDVIQAASEWKTAFDSGKRITDKDIALGEALIIEAGKRGDTERAIELISEVGIAATEAGKVVQAIKLLKRMTPEGQVYYLSKVVERLNKERGKTKGKEFNKSIEAENKATEADKKYKQAEAKVKTAEEKLFDIETAIEEYTKDLDIEVKIAESVEKIADFKKQLSEVKGKVKSADANTEKLGGKIKEIEGQLAEERNKLKEAMAKKDAILKERAEKGIMLSKLKSGVKRVDNATDHILSQIDILEDDISKVEAEYDNAVKFRDECAEERRRLIKERNFLIKDTEAGKKAAERYSKEISQLEEQISELSDKHIAAKSAAIQASLIRKQLKAERNELSSKLAKIENAIDWENENRETEIAKLKEEIAQLLNAEYEASKELEKAKEERTLKQKAKDKARKLSSAAKMGANIIELPADIKKEILESKTEEELNESVELAKDYIADNMVATVADRIKAWRYLSMLGNTLTQFRNITSNLIMLLNVLQKNVVATPIETVVVYASHKNLEKKLAKMKADGATEAELTAYRDEHYAERTKTITAFKKKSAELKNFVTESWESNIKLAKGQSGKNDNIIGDINDRRTIFKSEKPVLKQVAAGVEAWRKATNWAMERGDEVFLRINYKHALTSYILSNKWDVATMTEAQKMRAEQYALKEAQEATFRDESVLADWINKGRNKGWAAELAIGGLLPFTKTPINITKRSIEYGPTGIVNSIVQGVKASKGQATSADVVNALAKTFSGSALAGLGFVLAAMGLLRSKGDEEDEEYNYLIGEQDYSLIIGDYRFSLEWAAPAAVPLLFGAAIYEAWFDKDGGIKEEYIVDKNGNLVLNTRAMAIHKVMNAASAMFAPIFEASYLSGLTDSVGAAFSFGSGDAAEGLAIFGINAGLSYANQFIPTVFGQIARTIDPAARRNNDYDKTSILPYSVQRGIEKSKNKIPFLNQTSTPYVNAWGEEEIKKGALDYILSGAENFVLPGYIEKVTDDELTDELWRLEKTKAAEGKKVFPESVKTSYTEDGKTIPLTAEQRNERQKVTGQKGREYIEAFYNSDEYGKLTDAERVEAIDLLWGKANEEGIQAVNPDYVSSDTNVERLNYAEKNIGISPEDYALWRIAYERANEDGNNSYNMDEVDAALDIFIELSGEEWTDEQLGYLWQQRSTALSNKNPYGYALKGTSWYKAKKEDGQTWKNER
jgi:hypothetical protein